MTSKRLRGPMNIYFLRIRSINGKQWPTMISLGNYPQAFNYIEVIASGGNLAQLRIVTGYAG